MHYKIERAEVKNGLVNLPAGAIVLGKITKDGEASPMWVGDDRVFIEYLDPVSSCSCGCGGIQKK